MATRRETPEERAERKRRYDETTRKLEAIIERLAAPEAASTTLFERLRRRLARAA